MRSSARKNGRLPLKKRVGVARSSVWSRPCQKDRSVGSFRKKHLVQVPLRGSIFPLLRKGSGWHPSGHEKKAVAYHYEAASVCLVFCLLVMFYSLVIIYKYSKICRNLQIINSLFKQKDVKNCCFQKLRINVFISKTDIKKPSPKFMGNGG